MIRISGLLFALIFLWSCTPNHSEEKIQAPDTVQTTIKDTSSSQTALFKWDNELCQNTGTYKSDEYTEAQLKDTYTLSFGGIALETETTVFKPEDLEKLKNHNLEEEYQQKKKELEQLNPVTGMYWQKLKKDRLQELEEDYELRKITLAAYQNPQVLLENRFVAQCQQYAKALASKDSTLLLTTWKAMAEEHKKKNGSPEQYMQNFYTKYTSTDKLVYAKVELMTFGWWNCANQQINRVNQDMKQEEEFNKLFVSIDSQCDEP